MGFKFTYYCKTPEVFFWKAFVLQGIIPIWYEKIRLQTVVNNSQLVYGFVACLQGLFDWSSHNKINVYEMWCSQFSFSVSKTKFQLNFCAFSAHLQCIKQKQKIIVFNAFRYLFIYLFIYLSLFTRTTSQH